MTEWEVTVKVPRVPDPKATLRLELTAETLLSAGFIEPETTVDPSTMASKVIRSVSNSF